MNPERPDYIRKLSTTAGDVYQKAIGVDPTHLLVPIDFVLLFSETVNRYRHQLEQPQFRELLVRAEAIGLTKRPSTIEADQLWGEHEI